jgi:hypothetical protein
MIHMITLCHRLGWRIFASRITTANLGSANDAIPGMNEIEA